MENVAPGILQRLRAADIIRMAGLSSAALGQEYERTGSIANTQRSGARLSGVVTLSHASTSTEQEKSDASLMRSCIVSVELQSSTSWLTICSCHTPSTLLCSHGAALLYHWLATPALFLPVQPTGGDLSSSSHVGDADKAPGKEMTKEDISREIAAPIAPSSPVVQPARSPAVASDLLALLAQLSLSDLRNIAREYEIVTTGLAKQQLAEEIFQALQQPETVRRLAATLEKSQRQLLAALTLAGGSMTDEDLRGLFERFSLGQANQLQKTLLALQGRAMIFRTSLNSALSQPMGLSGSLLDVGWFVPLEVRAALRVSVPVTTFHVEQGDEQGRRPRLELAEPFRLLSQLMLIARALDGYRLATNEDWPRPAKGAGSSEVARPGHPASGDGSMAIPAPTPHFSAHIIAVIRETVSASPTFIRFALRLLQLADIVYIYNSTHNSANDGIDAELKVLSKAAQLLLGTDRAEGLRDLFDLWLKQSSYDDLFALQDDGLRLRCRTTSSQQPILRVGELETENSEARQSILALLAQAPTGQWMSFPAFARFVYRLQPLFLQRRQRLFAAPHWWIEQDEGRPLRPIQLSDWFRAEAHYLTHLLTGPLHWWGICDVAYAPDGHLLAFRLTDLASSLLHEAPIPQQSEQPVQMFELLRAVNEEKKELLVTCSPVAWPLIEALEVFAEADGIEADCLRYRLTPRALGMALNRGYRPLRLLELLRAAMKHHTEESALTTLVLQLEQWIASYGQVRIYTGVPVLETMDAVVMRELAATTSVESQIVQSISPSLHLLKKTAVERLTEELKRRGQTPLLHDEEIYGSE
ncbi:hypothetical protein [Tengunoibacter tsumagoiensis]|uniref:SWIM-type domain-containing protein n=1 Tax=Tengunoibacter tsumagoiensis TaxID=2014871 RepID=A0A402A4J8_9CHLR|nr:hypothetical protein [Tengunoibacter tsumagoiensis]GCE14077.1 hypothetical protein KTT_39360 [Tengunoibacter tsumagoiensis]